MMGKFTNAVKYLKGSYIFTFLCFAFLIMGIVIFFYHLQIEKRRSEEYAQISKQLNELKQAYPAPAKPSDPPFPNQQTSRKPIAYLPANTPKNPTITEAVSLLTAQFDSFKSDWGSILTFLGIAIAVFTIVMPFFNYIFLQKDTLEQMRKELRDTKNDIENRNKQSEEITHVLIKHHFNTPDNHFFGTPVLKYDLSRALELSLKGYKFFREENYEEAYEYFKEASYITPKDAKLHNFLALMLHTMIKEPNDKKAKEVEKKAKEAEKEAKKAVTLEPDNAQYHTNLGMVLFRRTRFKEACKSIEKAIQLNPENANFYFCLSLVLSDWNHYPEALKAVKEAVRLDPENTDYQNHLNLIKSKIEQSNTQP